MQIEEMLDKIVMGMAREKFNADSRYCIIKTENSADLVPFSKKLTQDQIIAFVSKEQIQRGLSSKQWDHLIQALRNYCFSQKRILAKHENNNLQ